MRSRVTALAFASTFLALVTVTFGGILHAQEAPEQGQRSARTLAQFLEEAEANYPALQADEFALAAAEARLGEARFSPFFRWTATAGLTVAPRANGTAIFSDQDQLSFDGWGPALGVDVEGAIPLYTFGKLRGLRRAARAGVSAASHERERTLARVQYDVRRAYYGLQLALDLEQMFNEGRGQLDRAVRKLDELVEAGDPSVSPMDRRRLGAAVAEIEARASEIQRLRESSEAALRALTGVRQPEVPPCPMVAAPVESTTIEAMSERAHGARPEARMLDAAIDAREADLSIQRAGYAPDIALAFRAGLTWTPGRTDQNNPWIADPANQPSLGAGILLRWNLDLAGNVFRTRGAEARLAETRLDAQEARAGMTLEVELAVSQLEDARRREAAWSRGERETRAWFVGAAQAYDVGTLEPRELIDALKGYFEARASHLRALMEFNVAAAQLERVTGTPVLPAAQWEPVCE